MTSESQHISIRLPSELMRCVTEHAREQKLTRSAAIIALIEKGLEAGCPTECTTEPDLLARVEALEATVAKLETRSPHKPKAGELDPARHYLGALCQRGHEWQDSGQSRYSKRNQGCLECEAERARERRAAKNR